MNVPPFSGLADNSYDVVITFQVIEHIEQDKAFLQEIHRVLKPGGKAIITTPNLEMSLTRNPWHVREYKASQLQKLLSGIFAAVEMSGVIGSRRVNEYYERNKASVARITRFDIFNLQYRLPRQLLQIPYDFLNRLNRKKLLNQDESLVTEIGLNDYQLSNHAEVGYDFFCIAKK
jgi:SAM-dependent methyltransferase